ncbi:MAG: lipid-A-disaccharide synthase [Gemmatimonadetes bacterium]|nr:lipid-A-disaccharide synthase [Gemmatimonadota bacterium]
MSRPHRIYLSAGEPSGDDHAAAVAAALRRRLPGVELEAFGGPRLEAAGARVLDRMESFSVVGFVEALSKIPAHYRLLGRVRRAFREHRYDLVILVDYPGYHLRVAAAAAAAGIPVLYYIAPQMWAWGAGRVPRLKPVHRLAVILPFEEGFFRERGVPATFVGHPLKDRPSPPPRAEARRALGLDPARLTLGLFPGSRAQEVGRLWPEFREAARRITATRSDVQVVVAGTPRGCYPDPGAIHIHQGDPLPVFAAADAGICKSGTTTLEAALADVPMAIAYRLNALSYIIARRLLQVPWVGLVNLVAGYEVSPELLQSRATPQNLTAAVLPLLDPDGPAARRQREGLALVRERLGAPGAAERVAALAAELLG